MVVVVVDGGAVLVVTVVGTTVVDVGPLVVVGRIVVDDVAVLEVDEATVELTTVVGAEVFVVV